METITVTNRKFGKKLLEVVEAKKQFIAKEQSKIKARKQSSRGK